MMDTIPLNAAPLYSPFRHLALINSWFSLALESSSRTLVESFSSQAQGLVLGQINANWKYEQDFYGGSHDLETHWYWLMRLPGSAQWIQDESFWRVVKETDEIWVWSVDTPVKQENWLVCLLWGGWSCGGGVCSMMLRWDLCVEHFFSVGWGI